MNIAAWGVAGVTGYFLCAPPSLRNLSTPHEPTLIRCVNRVFAYAGLRPKWYPDRTVPKAREFTPKEVAEWNERADAPGKKRS